MDVETDAPGERRRSETDSFRVVVDRVGSLPQASVELAEHLIPDYEPNDDRRKNNRKRDGSRRDESEPCAKAHVSRRA